MKQIVLVIGQHASSEPSEPLVSLAPVQCEGQEDVGQHEETTKSIPQFFMQGLTFLRGAAILRAAATQFQKPSAPSTSKKVFRPRKTTPNTLSVSVFGAVGEQTFPFKSIKRKQQLPKHSTGSAEWPLKP